MSPSADEPAPRDPGVPEGGAEGGGEPRRGPVSRRRRWLVVGVVGLLLVLAAGGAAWLASGSDDGSRAYPAGPWLSGAAGTGVVDGAFEAWRGRSVEIAGTWVDNNEAMVELWTLHPGTEFGDWERDLDVAIGAIGEDETWAAAADGAYDDRWRESLTNLRDLWAGRSGTLYIRFAHEMNGNWFPWSVTADERDDFVEAWRRFRGLQREILPGARLVFCVNRESLDTGLDWRETFPGREYVDVMGVDYYNQYPYVGSDEEWADSAWAVDGHGAPKGIERHREFARSVGLPLAVPEWSGNADNGDSPVFVEQMYAFFEAHAGTGPGELLYEILFNIEKDGDRWHLFGEGSRMPESAAAYRAAWSME